MFEYDDISYDIWYISKISLIRILDHSWHQIITKCGIDLIDVDWRTVYCSEKYCDVFSMAYYIRLIIAGRCSVVHLLAINISEYCIQFLYVIHGIQGCRNKFNVQPISDYDINFQCSICLMNWRSFVWITW